MENLKLKVTSPNGEVELTTWEKLVQRWNEGKSWATKEDERFLFWLLSDIKEGGEVLAYTCES